jgi:hypothetical protein
MVAFLLKIISKGEILKPRLPTGYVNGDGQE